MDEPGMKAGTLRPQMPVGPPRRHHRDLDVVDVFVEFLEFSLHRFGVLPSMGLFTLREVRCVPEENAVQVSSSL
jgi:hypothetical protein